MPSTSPTRIVVSSQRCNSLSLLPASARCLSLPLSRFQILASARPSSAPLAASRAKAACNSSPPRAPPLPTGPNPLARARRPPHVNPLVSSSHDDIPAGNARCRARHRLASHLLWGHGAIMQKAPKPHLLSAVASEPPHTTARPSNQGGMQRSPPFDRRRSPNRPRPNSGLTVPPANHHLIHAITPANRRQDVCIR